MRTGRLKLAIALAATMLGAPAAAQGPASDLERSGWTLVTASEDVTVYMRMHSRCQDGVRKVWTAYDSAGPRQRDGFTFRSVESLGEFDCKKRLSRVVEEIYHESPGLQGRAWRSPKFMVTPWAAPQPDSVGAIRMAYACRALSDT
jgi:hypothetical protein